MMDLIDGLQPTVNGSPSTDRVFSILTLSDANVSVKKLTPNSMRNALLATQGIPEDTVLNSEFWLGSVGRPIFLALVGESLPNSQSSNVSELDHAIAQSAFARNFERRNEIVVPILKYLDSCASAWDKANHYSACVFLSNSSMMAKSRSVSEMAEFGVFVFTICLRRAESTGFPPRLTRVADMLELTNDKVESTRNCCGLLIVCLELLTDWLKSKAANGPLETLSRNWRDYQTSQFWDEIVERVAQMTAIEGDKVQRELHYYALMEKQCQLFQEALRKRAVSQRSTEVRLKCLKVIFAFDEPSQLRDTREDNRFKKLDYLRRAFRIFPQQSGLLGVFSDTNSSVAALAPPKSKDVSLRAVLPGVELFPPFWQLATIDVWPRCREPLTVGEVQELVNYSMFGRPGFHAIAQAENGPASLLHLLQAKLVTNHSLDKLEQADALAVIGARTSLHVAASCQASSILSASHMRMCIGISKDRESVYTFQLPEPALAHAAMRFLNTRGWDRVLDHLKSAIGATYADPGYRGELMAQILMLMASDQTVIDLKGGVDSDDLPAIPLIDLFKKLLGENQAAKLKPEPVNQYVRFTQFVQMFCKPTQQKLADLWKRSTAIVCMNNNAGCDLLIPVLCVNPEDQLSDVLVEAKRMTVFALQVKCYSRPLSSTQRRDYSLISLSDCGDKLNTKLPFYSALIELRGKQERQEVYPSKGGKQSFALSGLKPSDVMNAAGDKVDKQFESLCTARFDPRDNPELSHLDAAASEAAKTALKWNFAIPHSD